MAQQQRAEPMNASPHHSKVKVSITLGDSTFVAGTHVSGKMEMECKADKGLGINIVMLELFAIQELTSRDHSATSTFLHSRRLFQGPGLPPSNAVQAHPLPGDTPLPPNCYQARRGTATFLFKFPLPASSPASISFGSGLARVRYELRATVGASWKGEKRLVTDKMEVDVVESADEVTEEAEPEGVVVGENGKIWMQATVVGGVVIAGESACVELQVKNHSNKKNSGLSIALTRSLHLCGFPANEKSPLQLSDTLTTVAFRGPEYIIPPGGEGVANLVFDVPKHARGVKGGARIGEQALQQGPGRDHHSTDCLFEVRCLISVKMSMGLGSKDIHLDLPVLIVHPLALPDLPPPEPYYGQQYDERSASPLYAPPQAPFMEHGGMPSRSNSPYAADRAASPYRAVSPYGYVDQGQVWLPPPPAHPSHTPVPYGHYAPDGQHYFPPPPMHQYQNMPPPVRPTSAGSRPLPGPPAEAEGKGVRASRIAQNLHQSSRNRSVSPQGHRFATSPVTAVLPVFVAAVPPSTSSLRESLPPSVRAPSPPRPPVAIPKPKVVPIPPPQSPPSTSSLRALSDSDPSSHIASHQSLTLVTQNFSPSKSQNSLSPAVHSPRPILSPKQSFTDTSRPRSERVEDLERMADLVTADLSKDIPTGDDDMHKTFPSPPVPTGKETSLLSRTRLDNVFLTPEPKTKAPITPFLRPIGRTESGLDALERKLLAQVGTQKVEPSARPDVRSVMAPMDIPTKPEEPLNDSAISSLTLAEHEKDLRVDEDDRTHKPTKSTKSGDGREVSVAVLLKESEKTSRRSGRFRGDSSTLTTQDKERESERRSKRKKEKVQDAEAHTHRKSAKGRVAEWLGSVMPEPVVQEVFEPPPIESIPDSAPAPAPATQPIPVAPRPSEKKPKPEPSPRPKPEVARKPSAPKPANAKPVVPPSKAPPVVSPPKPSAPVKSEPEPAPSAPNPRSSGFMPIGTMRKEIAKRPTAREAVRAMEQAMKVNATEAIVSPKPRGRQLPVQATAISPLSATWAPLKKSPSATPPAAPGEGPFSDLKPPRFPGNLDPEVKYDIRSARGGRGGKVTSVASLWASGTIQETTKPVPDKKVPVMRTNSHSNAIRPSDVAASASKAGSKPDSKVGGFPKSTSAPAPKFADFGGKRPAPMIKSMSIPAMMSPSIATPTLSSTASLAVKVPAIITSPVNTRSESRSMAPPAQPKSPPPLAFGQTRLRDLIMKYQGQSATK